MPLPKPDCYDYVRRNYRVPAYIGVRVSTQDLNKPGVIVPATSDLHYVHVRFDHLAGVANIHPRELNYHVIGRDAGAEGI